MLLGRHQDFSIRERERIVRQQQSVHVVGVIVRNDDGIDRLGVDAGSRKIGLELAVRPLAADVGGLADAGVDDVSFEPVFTTTGVYGLKKVFGSRYAAANMAWTSAFLTLVTRVSGSGWRLTPSVTTVI